LQSLYHIQHDSQREFGNSVYKRLFLNPVIFGFYRHLKYSQVKSVTPQVRDQFITSHYYKNCAIEVSGVFKLEVTGEDTGMLHVINMTLQDAQSQESEFLKKIFCINGKEFAWYQPGNPYTSLRIPPGYSSSLIDVKFKEGTSVDHPEELFYPQQLKSSIDHIDALFAPSTKPGYEKLKLWFRITLKPGTDALNFIAALQQLATIEIVEPAPLPAPLP